MSQSLDSQILEALRNAGHAAEKNGWPDVWCKLADGQNICIEIKSARDRVKPHQVETMRWLFECGIPCFVLHADPPVRLERLTLTGFVGVPLSFLGIPHAFDEIEDSEPQPSSELTEKQKALRARELTKQGLSQFQIAKRLSINTSEVLRLLDTLKQGWLRSLEKQREKIRSGQSSPVS